MIFPRLLVLAALSLVARGHEDDRCDIVVITIDLPVEVPTAHVPAVVHTIETPTTLVTVVRPTTSTTSTTTSTSTTQPTTSLSTTTSTTSTTPATTSTTSTTSTASTKPTTSTSTTVTPTPAAATPKPAVQAAESSSVSGKSTFYGGNLAGGACSFSTYSLPAGLFGTAYSGQVWDSAAECGRCVRVTGPNGNSITAMIVDECPECDQGHLDLFQDAFAELGALSAGIIATSYAFVPCGIASPLVLHSKPGTSAYYFALQVVNANEGIAALDVSTDGGATWQPTSRADYNFFEQPAGFGTDTVDVRLTSTAGDTVVVSGVRASSGAQTTASSNF